MMKFLIPLSVVSILFFSCNTNKNTPNYADASFDVVIESSYGGKDEKSYEVIKSNSELEKAIQNMVFDEVIPSKLASIDFNKKMVVSLHSGLKNTGGYGIQVKSVQVKGDTTVVTVLETSPGADAMVTMALTNPYTIVIMDKNKKVLFK
ncbi:MAG: hypothetical protein COZ75_04025 [Flavobacteriaceae bacterium CG_4_8_14_3_um_filter_34_10]|nr:protease complex subunit PrcB family protein [Flavobacteriia bacterium]PIQ17756.1 MAG: hypothetical protein COW66_09990 [Flavobacteriaceae bacterium CG18_big_fil_WC_8_21_14_2_50_34_36]PIV50039.1 MAG: hypothetical protein COS19_05560 [Flavobacteriaceae bacterium CG02_land_8_20_14_3_00_34_13]PIX09989.1 MAG: hypothetical protein COZ75_04025 [Flavobacteriaceae bacterium CG_4_8_14_3_um_filter_34_10]PIZ07724.1 MAG: hypothetical protein COY56_07360 [Flavobacteriaceae bacterium CG_4_10_14_0_8_um_fil